MSFKKIENFDNYLIYEDGRIFSLNVNRFIKPTYQNGYLRIGLIDNNKKRKTFLIHRLVYEAFNEPIPEGFEIKHIDGNRDNNNLTNLRLLSLTHKEKRNEYYKKNKDKYKEYREKNKEEINRKKRERYEKNKEEINRKRREKYEKNKEEINKKRREYEKKYRENNRDKINYYNKQYYWKMKEERINNYWKKN